MNKEEAIERCNKLIKVENVNWIGISNQKAIETVLNLIQEQKKEIEYKQDDINVLEAQRDSIENQFEQAKSELEKKDKIIDLMAYDIATNDSNLCQYIDETIRCKKYAGENKLTCDECIKQYFEKKVEKEYK